MSPFSVKCTYLKNYGALMYEKTQITASQPSERRLVWAYETMYNVGVHSAAGEND